MSQTNYIAEIQRISISNKYSKWYCSIISNALVRTNSRQTAKRLLGYVETHHILPKCFGLGGETDANNLCHLTCREHFIVHKLLTRMFTGRFNQKMWYALFRLINGNGKMERPSLRSSEYASIKAKACDEMSKMFTGINRRKTSNVGRVPWNKGLNKDTDSRVISSGRPKGSGRDQIPWNKGLGVKNECK